MTRRRGQLVGIWLVAAVGLGAALLAARVGRDPLDAHDLAYQRPGILDVHGEPFPAPPVTEGIPTAGMRTVVFFTRPPLVAELTQALVERRGLGARTQAVIVVAGAAPPSTVAGIPVVPDPAGQLAAAYRMDQPRDGGPPVGYAIVDSAGRVRYHTLDPSVADQLEEVATMVEATP